MKSFGLVRFVLLGTWACGPSSTDQTTATNEALDLCTAGKLTIAPSRYNLPTPQVLSGDQTWNTCEVVITPSLAGPPVVEGNLTIAPGTTITGSFKVKGNLVAKGERTTRVYRAITFKNGFIVEDGSMEISHATIADTISGVVFNSSGNATLTDVSMKRTSDPGKAAKAGFLFQHLKSEDVCGIDYLLGGTITLDHVTVEAFDDGIVSHRSTFFEVRNSTIRNNNVGLRFTDAPRIGKGCGTSALSGGYANGSGPNTGDPMANYETPCPILAHNDIAHNRRNGAVITSDHTHYEISKNNFTGAHQNGFVPKDRAPLFGLLSMVGTFDATSFVRDNNFVMDDDPDWIPFSGWGVDLGVPGPRVLIESTYYDGPPVASCDALPFFAGNYWGKPAKKANGDVYIPELPCHSGKQAFPNPLAQPVSGTGPEPLVLVTPPNPTIAAASVAANQVLITEFMADPDQFSDATGEWIEIHNPTNSPIAVDGLVLKTQSGSSGTIAGVSVLQPKAYALLGRGSAATFQGCVKPIGYYGGLTLANSGSNSVSLHTGTGTLIARVSYNGTFGSLPGKSYQMVGTPKASGGFQNATLALAGCMDLGSPGSPN